MQFNLKDQKRELTALFTKTASSINESGQCIKSMFSITAIEGP